MARAERDPGLPIKLHPVSNGEFIPPPMSRFTREVIKRANDAVDRNARRTGMTRRQFLLSSCGAATTLAVLSACASEEKGASSTATDRPTTTGGSFSVPPEATTEPSTADTVLGGDDFIFDVQGHLLEYPEGSSASPPGFPQASCGDDPQACFDTEHFLDLVLGQSQTSMVVLSAVPFGGGVLSPDVMARAIDIADRAGCTGRVLMQGEAHPARGDLAASLDDMDSLQAQFPVSAWKVYTHAGGPQWFFDDHDLSAPQVGNAFLDHVAATGIPIVAVHKGLSSDDPFASPVDIGPAAAAHPDVSIVVYHSGLEVSHREGPYDASADPLGADRLIRSLADAGIEPGGNVYAELGSTWRTVMGDPDQAAHLLGKLLLRVGPDNVVWGTDSIWYGSPQDQIDAFRTFEISEAWQEEFGYPALTPDVKAKILGLNSARLYGIDPIAGQCAINRDELQAAQEQAAAPFATHDARLLRA